MAPRHLPLIDEARIYADEAAGSEPRHCGKLGVSRAAYPGSSDGDEREPGSRFTSRVLDLQPSKPAVEALANRRRGLGRTAVAFHAMDQASASARSASRTALLGALTGSLGVDLRA